MAAEEGKVDPMHQFSIEPMFGTDHWEIAGYNIAFTNSALWMAITTVVLFLFVWGGMKRELVPGRWQVAVESMTGFIDSLLAANVGKAGKKKILMKVKKGYRQRLRQRQVAQARLVVVAKDAAGNRRRVVKPVSFR